MTDSNVNFSISETAAERISVLLSDEKPNSRLRISVNGGGCNGFQYKFDFDDQFDTEEDLEITSGNARVVIDKTSLEFVEGAEINYVISLGAQHFEIRNPNAASSCGCGNSFSV